MNLPYLIITLSKYKTFKRFYFLGFQKKIFSAIFVKAY